MVEEEAKGAHFAFFSVCLSPDWKFSTLCHPQTEPISSSDASHGRQADTASWLSNKHLESIHYILQKAQQSCFYLGAWLIIISQAQIARQRPLKEVCCMYNSYWCLRWNLEEIFLKFLSSPASQPCFLLGIKPWALLILDKYTAIELHPWCLLHLSLTWCNIVL